MAVAVTAAAVVTVTVASKHMLLTEGHDHESFNVQQY